MTRLTALPMVFAALLAACGGGTGTRSGSASSSVAVGLDEVAISGHIAAAGTKGSLLVFAFPNGADPATTEPYAVASVDASGNFELSVPPGEANLSLTFLADGANDGAIDGGDPLATLSGAALANIQGGSTVTLDDLTLDFSAKTAHAGKIDVQQAGGAAAAPRTPTPIPAE